MATSVYLHPLTIAQRTQLDQDLRYVEERVRQITELMRATHGEDSQAAIRADQISGAIQRLKWELERMG